jgi:hypothetical protein
VAIFFFVSSIITTTLVAVAIATTAVVLATSSCGSSDVMAKLCIIEEVILYNHIIFYLFLPLACFVQWMQTVKRSVTRRVQRE